MVMHHSDNETRNLVPLLHRLLFQISCKGSFMCMIPHTGYHIPQPLLTSSEALTGTRNSSIDPTTYCNISGHSATELHLALCSLTMINHKLTMYHQDTCTTGL